MLQLDAVQTLAFAGIALFLGYALCRFVPVLSRYNLPAPVVGGLVVALVVLVAHQQDTVLFQLDTSLQAPLMIAFFTTIGMNASLSLLKSLTNTSNHFQTLSKCIGNLVSEELHM